MTKRSTHEEKEIAWECNKLYFFALYNEYIIPLYFVLCKKNKKHLPKKTAPLQVLFAKASCIALQLYLALAKWYCLWQFF